MKNHQPGILAPIPSAARYLTFIRKPETDPVITIKALAKLVDGDSLIIGLGKPLVEHLDADIPAFHDFPVYSVPAIELPSTPADLWCWLRGDERGELVLQSRDIRSLLAPAFDCIDVVDAFRHGIGRDLTGYEDGTENPEGEEAVEAAFDTDGSSYVAVQKWKHDFQTFHAMSPVEQDESIGRRISDNEEMEDAPESAHVKRTEQESFEPEATLLRRSMPWADADGEGLNFVAFGRDFTAFEAQLNRMVGGEDGIKDALFKFTQPLTGSYFWCPPMINGKLDLEAIGI
ncbi:MAG: Dyp-type peroxidase [Pontiella sp.]